MRCEHCNREFKPAKASRRFCSRSCSNRGSPRGQSVKRCEGSFYERNSERIKAERREQYRTDPEYRAKVRARVAAHERGKLQRRPCGTCGALFADKHHHDYSKPFEYVWLCRACHIQHHAAELGTWGEGLKRQ